MSRGRPLHRVISKTLQLPTWNQDVKQQIISFWSARGFSFSQESGDTIVGTRGSIWGNLTSFDMSKLISTLTVSINDSACCTCTLDVYTIAQTITPWNAAHWQLELDTFENWILYGNAMEHEWAELQNASAKSNLLWVSIIVFSTIFLVLVSLFLRR